MRAGACARQSFNLVGEKRRRVPDRKANIPERPCERAEQVEPEHCLKMDCFVTNVPRNDVARSPKAEENVSLSEH